MKSIPPECRKQKKKKKKDSVARVNHSRPSTNGPTIFKSKELINIQIRHEKVTEMEPINVLMMSLYHCIILYLLLSIFINCYNRNGTNRRINAVIISF